MAYNSLFCRKWAQIITNSASTKKLFIHIVRKSKINWLGDQFLLVKAYVWNCLWQLLGWSNSLPARHLSLWGVRPIRFSGWACWGQFFWSSSSKSKVVSTCCHNAWECPGLTCNADQANILCFIWFDLWLALNRSWTGDKEIKSVRDIDCLLYADLNVHSVIFLLTHPLKDNIFTFCQSTSADSLHPSQAT